VEKMRKMVIYIYIQLENTKKKKLMAQSSRWATATWAHSRSSRWKPNGYFQPFSFFFAKPKQNDVVLFGFGRKKIRRPARPRELACETRPAGQPLQAGPLARPTLSPPFWPAGQRLYMLLSFIPSFLQNSIIIESFFNHNN